MAAGLPRHTVTATYSNSFAACFHRTATVAQQQSTVFQAEIAFKQLQKQQKQYEAKIQSLEATVKDIHSHMTSLPNDAKARTEMMQTAGETLIWVVIFFGIFGGFRLCAEAAIAIAAISKMNAKAEQVKLTTCTWEHSFVQLKSTAS